MQIDDITNYLYSNMQTSEVSKLLNKATESLSLEDAKTVSANFSEMLKSEILKSESTKDATDSDISSMLDLANLSKTMSGSVLGTVTDPETLMTLSKDLLSSSSGREIVAKLAEGHLNSIVLTNISDLQ